MLCKLREPCGQHTIYESQELSHIKDTYMKQTHSQTHSCLSYALPSTQIRHSGKTNTFSTALVFPPGSSFSNSPHPRSMFLLHGPGLASDSPTSPFYHCSNPIYTDEEQDCYSKALHCSFAPQYPVHSKTAEDSPAFNTTPTTLQQCLPFSLFVTL